jgi:excisionase family DNA binding protein
MATKRKQRPGERKERMRAKIAKSAMASVEELGEVLGLGRNKAYELVRHGVVKAIKVDGRWLVPRQEIELIASGEEFKPGANVLRISTAGAKAAAKAAAAKAA